MAIGSNIYFASDFHLGAYADRNNPLLREKKVVEWLGSIQNDCSELYLLGDVFDFWFEYKHVVPKGFVRLLGKLAEMSDDGIEIHIFTGNHDVWMFDYFEQQFGARIHRTPILKSWGGKKFLIGHGDGLGPGDRGYKFIKALFTNRLAQRAFSFLHPFIGVELARFFSRKSREATGTKDLEFLGEKEFLIQFCNSQLQKEHIDYFIFGHRHLKIDQMLNEGKSRYVNLGEWFSGSPYAVFNGTELKLARFQSSF
jgi:UDP-2,3-diacylglucosamine hydrolase